MIPGREMIVVGIRTNMCNFYRKSFPSLNQQSRQLMNNSCPIVITNCDGITTRPLTHTYKRGFSGDSSSKRTNKTTQASVHPYRNQIIYISLTVLSIMSITVSYFIISDKNKLRDADVTNVGKPNVGGPWSLVDQYGMYRLYLYN